MDLSIRSLAEALCGVVGFRGELACDTCKPDGTLRKRVDTSKLNALDWNANIGLEEGLASTYPW